MNFLSNLPKMFACTALGFDYFYSLLYFVTVCVFSCTYLNVLPLA